MADKKGVWVRMTPEEYEEYVHRADAVKDAFDDGYNQGKADGYEDGFKEGYDRGYRDDGYRFDFDLCPREYDEQENDENFND